MLNIVVLVEWGNHKLELLDDQQQPVTVARGARKYAALYGLMNLHITLPLTARRRLWSY
jgi:hypothetical protein